MSLGMWTLGKGFTSALLHEDGQILDSRDMFQILWILGAKISVLSPYTQNEYSIIKRKNCDKLKDHLVGRCSMSSYQVITKCSDNILKEREFQEN